MLTQVSSSQESLRNLRRERALWHDGDHYTPALGCTSCPDRAVCGGLQLASSLYDCLGFCCQNPRDCDVVCRNKPEEFAQRVREVGGFPFDNVPRSPIISAPSLPAVIPLIYHGSGRSIPFKPPAVCLPLYSVICRHNSVTRYTSAAGLARGFGIGLDVPVILTGTAKDLPLERW